MEIIIMETERLDNCQNIKIPNNYIYSYDEKKTPDVNDFISLAHQQGLKVYYCRGIICLVDSCKKGKEIKDILSNGLHYEDTTLQNQLPDLPEFHKFLYQDGSGELIKNVGNIVYGCEDKEV